MDKLVNNQHIRPLTPKQKAIIDFVFAFHQQHGFSPSLQEIAKHFGNSTPTIHEHIELIKKKGYLKKASFQSRGLKPPSYTENTVNIPLLGIIHAGSPSEPFEDERQMITVPRSMVSSPSTCYALKVSGDSMISDEIWDGDIILIQQLQSQVQVGDIIVAVSDGEVTLKRYGGMKDGNVTLIPRNPSLKPFTVPTDTFEVRGKFSGLLRRG